MPAVDLASLRAATDPVIVQFAAAEPRRWDRPALLLELAAELGSLAHLVQHWDGFKRGGPKPSCLADECSDVLFIVLRLGREDRIQLPDRLEYRPVESARATPTLLAMYGEVAGIQQPGGDSGLLSLIGHLAALCDLFRIDLVQSHRLEMRIAVEYFAACGPCWPKLNPLRYPRATWRLWRSLRQRGRTEGIL